MGIELEALVRRHSGWPFSGPALHLDVLAAKEHYLYGPAEHRRLMVNCVTDHSALAFGPEDNQLTASVLT